MLMNYELMLPDQIRNAIKEGWPVVLPLGVIEYHGEHCTDGRRTLLVVKALEWLEKEMPLVILPPFHYGAASHAVAPPENNGTIHIGPNVLIFLGKSCLPACCASGSGIFTGSFIIKAKTLPPACRRISPSNWPRASPYLIFWRKRKARDGGDKRAWRITMPNMSRARIPLVGSFHPLMGPESLRLFPADHAGKQETSLMMAFCPGRGEYAEVFRRALVCP